MKTIKNLKSKMFVQEVANEETNKIFGGESTETSTDTTDTDTDTTNATTTTTPASNTKIVNVGNTIVDDLNGLIR